MRVVGHGGGQKNLEVLMAFKNKEAFKELCATQYIDWKEAICNFMDKDSMSGKLNFLDNLLDKPGISLENTDINELLKNIRNTAAKDLKNILSNEARLTSWLGNISSNTTAVVGGVKRGRKAEVPGSPHDTKRIRGLHFFLTPPRVSYLYHPEQFRLTEVRQNR